MNSDLQITGNRMQITRVFDAPRERVFDAWKRPDLIERWSGCKETAKVEITMDFRVGGSFTQKMDIDGAGQHTITGVYDEIIEPEKIAYHVNLGPATTRVVVEFIEQGRRTKVVLTQEGFPDQSIVKIVSTGTLESLDKLERLLLAQAA
jgi:uncharacterized protein YndB with AHSA1/START domain